VDSGKSLFLEEKEMRRTKNAQTYAPTKTINNCHILIVEHLMKKGKTVNNEWSG
jgi:hypothetical protein